MSKTLSQKHKEAKEAFAAYKAIETAKNYSVWQEGEYLKKLKDNGLYKFLFGDDLKWSQFLALPEVGIPQSTADQKIERYKKWILELGFTPEELKGINTRKLHRALPYVNKENAKEIVEKARNLAFTDFLAELTGEEPCFHETEDKTIKVCKKCGRKLNGK